jgi:hypothetical protein
MNIRKPLNRMQCAVDHAHGDVLMICAVADRSGCGKALLGAGPLAGE